MKKIITILSCLALAACGRPVEYNGKYYPTYGLFNENTNKSEQMCYEPSVGNIVLSVILIETVIMPIYFLGFSIFNPVGPKSATGSCGIDARDQVISATPTAEPAIQSKSNP
jgi:hypothetical protein